MRRLQHISGKKKKIWGENYPRFIVKPEFCRALITKKFCAGFMVTAVVTGNNFRGTVESTKVAFTFEKQHITSSSCEACPKKIWCLHLIAAILHRIKHANMV